MSKSRMPMVPLILFMSLFLAADSASAEELTIHQTDQRMKIDGLIDEWQKAEEVRIIKTPLGKIVEPSSDLNVTAYFTFDTENFYAAVKARDDSLEFPSRSWRYGDGFYLTFLDPSKNGESDRFYTFGFSRESNKDVKALVNKDGEYFPGLNIDDIELAIEKDEKKGAIIYELAIPWKQIPPLKPFIHEKWGLNLTYVDQDQGTRKHVVQLHPDQGYDTEISNSRKGAVVRFEKHEPRNPEMQSALNAAHFFDDEEKILTIAVNSPVDFADWNIRYELSSAKDNLSFKEDLIFKEGMNFLKFPIESRDKTSGTYVLSLAVIDNRNSLKFRSDHSYFLVNREEFAGFKKRAELAKASESFQKDEMLKASLPTYEIRLKWLDDFMKSAQPFADFRPLKRWLEELELLSKKIDEGKPALFPAGRIARLAHRSSIDNTLQPYSIFIPPTYTGQYPIPLFVTLHGSGVDERNTILYATRMIFRRGNFIILAPKARGLSDWYLGDSGKDVMECIGHVKKIYNIETKNIILDGFSMGGYGAWRLGILHPDVFRAIIVRSGAIAPPPYLKGDNILDILEKVEGNDLNVFIIHGEKDNAVPVEAARKAVSKLEASGIAHTYLELKNAAHGGYDRWHDIFNWLNRVMVDR